MTVDPNDRLALPEYVLGLETRCADLTTEVERLTAEESEWRTLVGALFHGEESPMLIERSGWLCCVDCGVSVREDISDILHEDGCTAGPLYHKLMASLQVESWT